MGPNSTNRLRQKFARTFELPAAPLMDYAIVSLVGNMEARITNHKGLLQYNTACVKANSLQGVIEVVGTGLQIKSFSSSEIRITGEIQQVMLK
ncbi:MAG: hypothetical protein GX101_01000 [Firmicutes bacterium]|nr:YabP/YqfC family sporulation protein [Bacillota bacterium]NLO65248.1 hypothetical protein [Bacillota bacterium]